MTKKERLEKAKSLITLAINTKNTIDNTNSKYIKNNNTIDISEEGIPPCDLVEAARSSGFKDFEDLETNGWDHDFWFTMDNPELKGTLKVSGGWYYGSFNIRFLTQEEIEAENG